MPQLPGVHDRFNSVDLDDSIRCDLCQKVREQVLDLPAAPSGISAPNMQGSQKRSGKRNAKPKESNAPSQRSPTLKDEPTPTVKIAKSVAPAGGPESDFGKNETKQKQTAAKGYSRSFQSRGSTRKWSTLEALKAWCFESPSLALNLG